MGGGRRGDDRRRSGVVSEMAGEEDATAAEILKLGRRRRSGVVRAGLEELGALI